MEGRALVRLLYENLLWLGALAEHGSEFVKEIISDERYKRKALAQTTMKLATKHGGDAKSPDAMTLRGMIKRLNERQNDKPLHADDIAAASAVEIAYINYVRFPIEAAHRSATALGRHISRERDEASHKITINVVAKTSPEDAVFTLLHACNALTGAAIAANEMVGFTAAGEKIATLFAEFQSRGWFKIL